jgi:predicted enzyme related to lactoylglutathione lyase
VYFRVDDIEAAAARVRAAGGEVLSVANYDSGGNAECRDDQGLRFSLFRPRAGY